MISTCLDIVDLFGWYLISTWCYGYVSVVGYLSTALGLHCWGCHSRTSWADCENRLKSNFCDYDPSWVCQTKVFKTTEHGRTQIVYSKECGQLSDCNAKFCNYVHGNTTHQCQLECCCHDNCNTGVLVQGGNEAIIESLHGVCKILTIIMAFYSTMTKWFLQKPFLTDRMQAYGTIDWHFNTFLL